MVVLPFPFYPAAVEDDPPAAELRQAAWTNGFRPLPVRTGSKVPAGLRWPATARLDPPPRAVPGAPVDPAAASTGILADGLRAVDVNVDDPVVAAKVEALAKELLGEAPTRYRADSPRMLLIYAAADGEPRKRVLEGKHGTVEILGKGQQFVADGTHPDGAVPGRQRGAVALHRAWLSGEPVVDGGELSADGGGTVEYGHGALATIAEVTRGAAGGIGALLLEASDSDWKRTPPSPAEIRAGLAGRDLACWCRLCPAHAGGKPLGTECRDGDPFHVAPLGAIANAPLACEET